MERGQGPSRRGPLDPHRVGPFCRIGVRVNAEPMRLEKSETPVASSARYAAHAPASARLLAQTGRPREPRTARAPLQRTPGAAVDTLKSLSGWRVIAPRGLREPQ